jgi:hypothetical protein
MSTEMITIDAATNAAKAADALREDGYEIEVDIGIPHPKIGPRIDITVIIGDPTRLHERYRFTFDRGLPTGITPSSLFASNGSIGTLYGPRVPFRNNRETAARLTTIVTEALS